jgi:TPR repeat protein
LSTCRFCAWLCRDASRLLWAQTDSWESDHSNEWELWSADSDHNRDLMEQALLLDKTNPEASFKLRLEAAEAGCAWGMEFVGHHYETGTVVETDLGKAREYYHRAIVSGSWIATLKYARVLAEQDDVDGCEGVLEDGVEKDFVPACFWLAWYRYKRSPTGATAREIRPLLDRAVDAGHPAADVLLKRLMISGKLGIREIPKGMRRIWNTVVDIWRQSGAPSAAVPQDIAHPAVATG